MIVTKDGLKYDGDSNPITLDFTMTDDDNNTVAYAEDTICNEIKNATISSIQVTYTDSTGSYSKYYESTYSGKPSDNPMEVMVLIKDTSDPSSPKDVLTVCISATDCFKITVKPAGDVKSVDSLNFRGTINYLFDNFLKIEKELTSIGKGLSVSLNASIGGDVSIGGSLTVPSDKGIEVGELTGGSINIGTMTGGEINVDSMCGGSIKIVHPKVSTTDEDYFGKVKFDFDIFNDKCNLIKLTINSVTKDDKGGGYIEELEDYHFYIIVMTVNGYKLQSLFYLKGLIGSGSWEGVASTLYSSQGLRVIEVYKDYDRGYYFFPYRIEGTTKKYYEESYLEEISLYKLPIWLSINLYDIDSFD